MISPEEKEILAAMKDSQFGVALKKYLGEKQAELNDISTTASWEETLGRKYALKVITDLFSIMEYKKPVDKGKNLYT
jgi:hypothetical protein